MINILILEDEPVFCHELMKTVQEVFPQARVIAEPRVPSVLPGIPDLAVVDIGLDGDRDGIQFMHEYGRQIPAILFYSICYSRIKETFGPNVLGFVEKGKDEHILKEKLLQARQIIEDIPVAWLQDQNRRMVPVRTDLICSCSRIDRTIWITDLQKRQFRTKSGKLDSAQVWFDDHFIWINQSEAVNIHQIQSVYEDCITLNNGEKLYMSRRYRKRLKQVLPV